MNPTGDHHDRLAFGDKLLSFGVVAFEGSRVSELALNLFEAFKVRQIRGRRDDREHEWPAQRCFAEFLKLDSIARSLETFEVIEDLRPRRELAIVSRSEPDHFTRGGNASCRCSRSRHTRGRWICLR